MKNKIYISIFIFVLSTLSINAQSNYYYYYKDQKVYLTLDKINVTLSILNDFQKPSVSTLNLKDFNIEIDNTTEQNNKYAKVEFQNTPTDIDYFQKLNSLNSNPKIIKAQPNFLNSQGVKVGMSDYFYIKLNNSSDYTLLQNLATQKNVVIIEQNQFMPLWYTLKCNKNTIGSTLEVANQFYESGSFASSVPDFLSNDIVCSNDTNFGSLWGLNNVSNPAIDINVCQAWTLSEGNGIKVAVLDQGIELTHQDLSTNIFPLSYNSETNTSPSQIFGDHGTHCAGTIGAIKNNSLQVVGVSPQAKLMSVSNSLQGTPNSRIKRADGINWAWQNGADIISNSWGSSVQYQVIDDAINNAILNGRNGKGTLIVFATGNNNSNVSYPANINTNIIAVGALTSSGSRSSFSNFGTQLDVVAPGSNILSTVLNNGIGNKDGTSMATPHVAGVCALVLSANPCLTGQQVRDIIEQTSQKVGGYSYTITAGRPNGTWNNQMGYGLVNAFAAVQMAQSMGSADLDLMVKDGQDDTGAEPNTVTQHMWNSDNIWVRNYNDSGLTHQNPDYSANGNPNYIKVRVINKSCVTSAGTEQLKLYWAKASTGLSWPNPWNGGILEPVTNALMGQVVGTLNIPTLQAGQEVILTFPWQVPNPANYSQDQWHFCLLARIEATADPMTSFETGDINANTRNNNNIAWKNVTVVDILPNNVVNPGGVVAVTNPFNHPKTFFLEMEINDLETGKPIYQEAEVGIKMNDVLFQAWERGGKEAQLLDPTLEENRKIVRGNHVILDNIAFNANETGTLRLDFNFLTKELTDKSNYAYHVIQKDAETGQVIGGETFIINKNPRPVFEAVAPDKEVDLNQAITISAENINEPAIYNWYDNDGNLIFQGKDLQIANAVSEKFKLEVISTTDGFKDYTEVEVTLKPSKLENIVPNPATNNVLVSYKLNGVSSAYLMVIGYYGSNGTSNNYILDTNSSEINLNVSNYQSGFYTVALVVNGAIVDAKTLIKQ